MSVNPPVKRPGCLPLILLGAALSLVVAGCAASPEARAGMAQILQDTRDLAAATQDGAQASPRAVHGLAVKTVALVEAECREMDVPTGTSK